MVKKILESNTILQGLTSREQSVTNNSSLEKQLNNEFFELDVTSTQTIV